MRILITTRGSAGHLLPLAPFGHACLRAGHEVLVAAQRQHRVNVERTGLEFLPVEDPPDHVWRPLMAQLPQLDIAEANARMVGEYFARIDTNATLPDLRSIVEERRPDLIVRESWEFASTLVAEMFGITLVRIGLGLAAVEELSIRLAAPALDEARGQLGLPPDRAGDRLRDTPYFTMVPEPLDGLAAARPLARRFAHGTPAAGPALTDDLAAAKPLARRFAHGTPAAAPALTDWWPGSDDPLVYLTFGSVTAGAHLPYFPALYRAAIDALAPLRVRVLVTIGDRRDPDELGPLPPNVHVERWVAQAAVAPHAAAIVCHGGYGSTLGALSHGVPLVVLPLFSADQWANAGAVSRAGAGIALDAELNTRRVVDLPGPDTLGLLGAAVQRVLDDPSYRCEARRLADATRALPPVDAAVDAFAAICGQRVPAPVLQH